MGEKRDESVGFLMSGDKSDRTHTEEPLFKSRYGRGD